MVSLWKLCSTVKLNEKIEIKTYLLIKHTKKQKKNIKKTFIGFITWAWRVSLRKQTSKNRRTTRTTKMKMANSILWTRRLGEDYEYHVLIPHFTSIVTLITTTFRSGRVTFRSRGNRPFERVTFHFESITLLFERYRIAFRTHFVTFRTYFVTFFYVSLLYETKFFERGFCYRWRAIPFSPIFF